ncbi:MAG: hypothetical protein GF390_02120 [Candidatus Pacebacteria bacterium]|nr:hypothetical protein [Candidatus Paceibacterota bacterium]
MKITTQKLMLWLYPVATQNRWVEYADLKFLLPDLSKSGRRSLVAWLKKKGWLITSQSDQGLLLSLTKTGQHQLVQKWPVLQDHWQDWQGEWSILLCLTAPKNDPGFRYLRDQLIQLKAINLTRGVYLYPNNFPTSLLDLVAKLYAQQVVIMRVNQWQWGDEQVILQQRLSLNDLARAYSGISKELKQLLMVKNKQKDLTDQLKKRLFRVFNRLVAAMEDDLGIVNHYFPRVEAPQQLLAYLQQLNS